MRNQAVPLFHGNVLRKTVSKKVAFQDRFIRSVNKKNLNPFLSQAQIRVAGIIVEKSALQLPTKIFNPIIFEKENSSSPLLSQRIPFRESRYHYPTQTFTIDES